jgi:hypothetical protein
MKKENPVLDDFDGVLFNDELAKAEAGDHISMYHVAFFCFNRFASENAARCMIEFALYYYHKSIRNGYRGAMFNLASIYYHGNGGVEIDRRKAYLLYMHSKASISKGELGVYYARGDVVSQDYEKAYLCFARCALDKIDYRYGSFANLARMYREGLFVEIDEKFADHCANLARKAEENLENRRDYP